MCERLLLTLLLICVSCQGWCQTFATPKREVRAVWLTTLKNLDWPTTYATDSYSIERQKEELRNILDRYVEANINTVLLQTVVRASTIYPSNIEPWDACMTGRFGASPGYDPLAFAVDECHKRGMEIHAWVVALPVGHYNGQAAQRLRRQGYKMFKLDGDAFLDPSEEATGNLVASMAREITTHYDIDGIHLDYMRYPEMLPAPKDSRTAQWRRDNITAIVRKVHDAVKAEKPWVKVSCSPIGKYSDLSRYSSNNWNARDRVAQDAQLWLRLGLMDQLYPMLYFRGDNFYPFAADWAENASGRTVSAGLGTYFLVPQGKNRFKWSIDDLTREMMVARQLGMGTAHFRSMFLTGNKQGIFDFQSLCFAPYQALVPPMTWESSNVPGPPKRISINEGVLHIDGNADYYNLYASDIYPVDVSAPENLILTRFRGKDIRIDVGTSWQPRYFAVTSMDRYGNESEGVQSFQPRKSLSTLLECDGKNVKVEIPKSCLSIEIRTLQGAKVKALNCRRSCGTSAIDVSDLADGVYSVFSEEKLFKKRTFVRRLGSFYIKRSRQV